MYSTVRSWMSSNSREYLITLKFLYVFSDNGPSAEGINGTISKLLARRLTWTTQTP